MRATAREISYWVAIVQPEAGDMPGPEWHCSHAHETEDEAGICAVAAASGRYTEGLSPAAIASGSYIR
jgi:hypothetical protein